MQLMKDVLKKNKRALKQIDQGTVLKSITFVEVVALRSPFAGNPAHLELLPPREGKITSAGDKEVDGAWSAIVPESGVELCQVNRQIERPNLLRSLLTNRHINCCPLNA